MIPGLKAIPALHGAGSTGSGSGGSLTLTLIASTTANGSSISVPAAAVIGDFAVLFDATENHGGSSISTAVPTGWTSLADTFGVGSYSLRTTVSYKILTAAGGSVSGMTGGSFSNKVLLIFRPSTSILTVTSSVWNAEVTGGNPTSQTVTASGVQTPLIVLAWGVVGDSPIPAFATETPSMTNVTRSGSVTAPACRVGYTIYNSSPSNQSIDVGDNGTVNGLQSGYVRFT